MRPGEGLNLGLEPSGAELLTRTSTTITPICVGTQIDAQPDREPPRSRASMAQKYVDMMQTTPAATAGSHIP